MYNFLIHDRCSILFKIARCCSYLLLFIRGFYLVISTFIIALKIRVIRLIFSLILSCLVNTGISRL